MHLNQSQKSDPIVHLTLDRPDWSRIRSDGLLVRCDITSVPDLCVADIFMLIYSVNICELKLLKWWSFFFLMILPNIPLSAKKTDGSIQRSDLSVVTNGDLFKQ